MINGWLNFVLASTHTFTSALTTHWHTFFQNTKGIKGKCNRKFFFFSIYVQHVGKGEIDSIMENKTSDRSMGMNFPLF